MALSVFKEEAMTFSGLARQRLLALVSDGGSGKTEESYDEAYGLFVEYLHAKGLKDDVREFTPENVSGFKEWLAARPAKRRGEKYKGSSINNRLAALSSLGKWGMSVERPGKDRLPENPVLRVTRPRKVKPMEKYLYLHEVRSLLALTMAPNERLVLEMFLDTALRASEVMNARVRDLRPGPDGTALALTVRVKGGAVRTVPLGAELSAKIEASLRQREAVDDSPVFVNQAGDVYKKGTLCDVVYRLARRAGITRIPVRPHVLRKTVATMADTQGASVAEIASLLNHSDMSTVQRYVFASRERVDGVRARVREALAGQAG